MQKISVRRVSADVVPYVYQRGIEEVAGTSTDQLIHNPRESKIPHQTESSLIQEVERLKAEAYLREEVTEQLWQALFDLREWHKEEYQSCRRIDAQADEALALLPLAGTNQRMKYLESKSACEG